MEALESLLMRSGFKGFQRRTNRGLLAWKLFFALIILVAGDRQVMAAEPGSKVKVCFGGFAFSGEASEISNNYPITAALNGVKYGRRGFVDQQVWDFFAQRRERLTKFELQFDPARREDTQLVLALGMTEEQVLQEDLGDFHKLVVQLGFELLVLDFRSREVVSSRPIFIEFIDAGKEEFDAAQIRERVRKMIEGPQSQLFSVIAEQCDQIQIREKNQATLRVKQVTIGEKALPFLPKALQQPTKAYGQAVAQHFGALLSARAGVSVLPYQKDALNTGRMALAFADGSMVEFTIPEPTYAIDLNLRGFKKVLQEDKPAEALWIYGAFLDVRIYEPDPKIPKTYFDTSFTYGIPKVVPSSQKNVDEYPVVSEALKGAFLKAIEQIQKDKSTRNIIKLCEL